jgi:hypothetical protein
MISLFNLSNKLFWIATLITEGNILAEYLLCFIVYFNLADVQVLPGSRQRNDIL